MTIAPQTKPGIGERILAWLLYAAMLVGILILLIATLLSVFETEVCYGAGDPSRRICDDSYLNAIIWIFWGFMGVVALVTPVLMVIGHIRGRRIWFYPATGGVLLVLAFIGYVVALAQ